MVPAKAIPPSHRGTDDTVEGRNRIWAHFTEEGVIQIRRVAAAFDLQVRDVVSIAGLPRSATRQERAKSAPTQQRIRQMVEILELVRPMAGSPQAAMAWYKAQPLPGFGRTAEQIVKEGHADAVRNYLDELAVGGFA